MYNHNNERDRKVMFSFAKKREKEEFKRLYEGIPDKVLRTRVQSIGDWYIESAFKYKRIFYSCSVLAIMIPVLVTTANGIFISEAQEGVVKVFTILGSAVTALSTAFLSFSKCREKWTLYRSTFERIKRELSIYWAKENADQRLESLIVKIEDYMKEEHEEWWEISRKMESRETNDELKKS